MGSRREVPRDRRKWESRWQWAEPHAQRIGGRQPEFLYVHLWPNGELHGDIKGEF